MLKTISQAEQQIFDLNELINSGSKLAKTRKSNQLKKSKMAKFMGVSTKSVQIKSKSQNRLENNSSTDNVQRIPISINKRNIGFPKDGNPLNSKIIPKA